MERQSALRIESLSRGSICYIRLYGVIDETFQPDQLIAVASGKDAILNLKAVSRLSSFGVREWVLAMRRLRERCERILLVECSTSFVAQMNMVANFAEGAKVVSVQAPYYCRVCGWDTEVTQQLVEQITGAAVTPQSVTCRRCHAPMELDDDPTSYFSFQQPMLRARGDAALALFMRDFAGAFPESRAGDAGAKSAAAAASMPPLPEFAPPTENPAGRWRKFSALLGRAVAAALRLKAGSWGEKP